MITGQRFSFIVEPEDWRRRIYFRYTDFEDVTSPETRPTWGRGKLATARDSAGVRVREKEMAATCNIVAVGFDRLNLGGWKSP